MTNTDKEDIQYHSYEEIPLEGLITDRKQEISSMTTYKDNLILLPENRNGYYFYIPFSEITNTLNTGDTIIPVQKTFTTRKLKKRYPGLDGFEAIAFEGDNVYIMVEIRIDDKMAGLLIWGTIHPLSMEIDIPKENVMLFEPPTQIDNFSFESLTIVDNELVILFEVNGWRTVKNSSQYIVDLDDMSVNKIPFPHIDFRLTDATSVIDNKFWAINYYWTGDKEVLGVKDTLGIERLVEYELGYSGIKRADSNYITLQNTEYPHNWEGLVRFDDGFLICTDKWPKMILGYIPK
tara:strand:- start:1893 stop:2768 length:876 start_codon:yes stop_codon:yes gene_type:complete